MKPPDYEPGRRYPTIVDLHGGPVAHLQAELHAEWNWLAAQGYVVFAPDFRESQLYGCYLPPTIGQDLNDVMARVDWLVEAGLADPDRLGVRGLSHGASLINQIISQTDRFRAAGAIAAGALS